MSHFFLKKMSLFCLISRVTTLYKHIYEYNLRSIRCVNFVSSNLFVSFLVTCIASCISKCRVTCVSDLLFHQINHEIFVSAYFVIIYIILKTAREQTFFKCKRAVFGASYPNINQTQICVTYIIYILLYWCVSYKQTFLVVNLAKSFIITSVSISSIIIIQIVFYCRLLLLNGEYSAN